MSGASTESDTAAWRELLPWATPEERRTLLDSEHAAALYAGALSAARIPQHLPFEPAAFGVFARVLVAVHGADPMTLAR